MNNAPRSQILDQRPVENFGPIPLTAPLSDRLLISAAAPHVASELIDQIGTRVNEGARVLRVMIVEDEAVIAMLLAEVITEMGHDVCAIEATEIGAVAAAVRCRPDMMILDARLGDGSGIAAIEQILCAGFVPHVFVSGDALRVRTLRPGAVVIQKPFRESDLAQAMQRALAAGVC
jgi:CheY-like chemotaxis protein